MNSVNRGVEMWHLGYNGPRAVEYVESFVHPNGAMVVGESRSKTVVLFNGIPEVVDEKDIYDTKEQCYAEAAKKSLVKATEEMQRAADYQREAAEAGRK